VFLNYRVKYRMTEVTYFHSNSVLLPFKTSASILATIRRHIHSLMFVPKIIGISRWLSSVYIRHDNMWLNDMPLSYGSLMGGYQRCSHLACASETEPVMASLPHSRAHQWVQVPAWASYWCSKVNIALQCTTGELGTW